MTEHLGSFVHCRSGRIVDPLDFGVEDVLIEDVAHALSNQCRFQGHTDGFYSVAQHAVICSLVVAPGFELDALLHDASEYVLQDMARPLKTHPSLGQAYRGAEKRIQKCIATRYGLRWPEPAEVKHADHIVFATEVRDLMDSGQLLLRWVTEFEIAGLEMEEKIVGWSPRRARREFLERFHQLYKEEDE